MLDYEVVETKETVRSKLSRAFYYNKEKIICWTVAAILLALVTVSIFYLVKVSHQMYDMEFAKQMQELGYFKEDIHLINFRLEYPGMYVQQVLSLIGTTIGGICGLISTAVSVFITIG